MKLKIVIASTIASIGLHIYLTIQHFGLVLGATAGDSTCNIASIFDCNAATASSFSKLAGIPVSIWGLTTNLVLLVFLLMFMFGFSKRSIFYAYLLSAMSAATSVAMGVISTVFLSTYCLYCVILYVLSFINFPLISSISRADDEFDVPKYFGELFSSGLSHTVFFAAIAPIAFLVNYSFVSSYQAGDLSKVVAYEVGRWNVSPKVEFTTPPTLTKGNPANDAKMIITEFADFRCGHCKHAAPPISAFVKSHKDVKLNFYVFPLDGECNTAITQKSGLSCYLAKAVFCANQQDSANAWKLHDLFFEHQVEVSSAGSLEGIKKNASEYYSQLNLDAAKLDECINSTETHNAILEQGKAGVAANVQGTPTVFVNGKKLSRGQLIPVLEAVYKSATSQ